MTILDEIVANKRVEIAARKQELPLAKLRAAAALGPRPAFASALRSVPMGLIAEVKRRSPSAGAIRDPFDPPAIARAYQAGGAQAISVLVDEKYFGGGADDVGAVRSSVRLPILYKEFVVDEWQAWHARSLGASAILLIAAVLDDRALRSLMSAVHDADLESLVEVHDVAELKRAADAGAALIGVNNRDLRDFSVRLETSYRCVAEAPKGCTFVSESGIRSADDVRKLKDAGVHAVLVGEHLLKQKDLARAVKELMGS